MNKLSLDKANGKLAGVCSGWGRYLGVDPIIIRLGFVLLSFFEGSGVLVYLVCWAVMPNEK